MDEARWDEARWDESRWDESRWPEARWDESRWDEPGREEEGLDSAAGFESGVAFPSDFDSDVGDLPSGFSADWAAPDLDFARLSVA